MPVKSLECVMQFYLENAGRAHYPKHRALPHGELTRLNDDRSTLLRNWLAAQTSAPHQILPASADASFRRYFRVILPHGATRIAMDAPPAHEDAGRFVKMANRLRHGGVSVPEIYACDLAQGFVLMEDFGSRHYADALDASNAEMWYARAFEQLAHLHALPGEDFPPYDAVLLQRELAIFEEWYLRHFLQLAAEDNVFWPAIRDALIASALAQPRVVVHRDFHCRNLMALPDGTVGVLDFQDAVYGPVTYDLVSLLRDCYIDWPVAWITAWSEAFYRRWRGSAPDAVSWPQFKQWFDWMGVQRHLKALGIFARLALRDGKPGYLSAMPRTMAYVRAVCAEYAELAPLLPWLEQTPHRERIADLA